MRTYDELKAAYPYPEFVNALGMASELASAHDNPFTQGELFALYDKSPLALELFGLAIAGKIPKPEMEKL